MSSDWKDLPYELTEEIEKMIREDKTTEAFKLKEAIFEIVPDESPAGRIVDDVINKLERGEY